MRLDGIAMGSLDGLALQFLVVHDLAAIGRGAGLRAPGTRVIGPRRPHIVEVLLHPIYQIVTAFFCRERLFFL